MDATTELVSHQRQMEEGFCAAVFFGYGDIARTELTHLDPDWFVRKDLGAFWRGVLQHGDPQKAAYDAGVGDEMLKLALDTPSSIYYQEYAQDIINDHYLFGVVSQLGNLVKMAMSGDVQGVTAKIGELSQGAPWGGVGARTPAQIHTDFSARLQQGFEMVPTYSDLDNTLGGLFAKEFSILAGRPGTGKSAFASQIAMNVARHGHKVLFISLEMSEMQLWGRMACPAAGFSWSDVRAKKVDAAGLTKIQQFSQRLQASFGDNLLVSDDAYTLDQMHLLIAKHRPKLVIIDHLAEVHWHKRDESPVIWYGAAAEHMRTNFAKKLACHVMLIHQLNRGVETRQDNRPLLADLRFSGQLEQLADVVLMTYREDLYRTQIGAPLNIVPFELWIRKHRQGETNVCVMFNYDLQRQTFASFGLPAAYQP